MVALFRVCPRVFISLLFVAVIVPGVGIAGSGNEATFRLGLQVPTICRIDVRDAAASSLPPAMAAATAEEFCNAPAGYRVVAVHQPAPSGEVIWFDYGGQRIRASAGGMTTLAEEPTAAHRVRSFAIISTVSEGTAIGNVALQIVPR